MTLPDITTCRLVSQQIATTDFTSPKEIVGWMGAMQAQDYAMAKWAIGVRLSGSTNQIIEAAIDKGDIIRTHLLRPTWHFVSADDIYWMLELTAPHIKASLKSRHKTLELSEAMLTQSNNLIEKALAAGGHLTREALMKELEKVNIATDNNRSSHLMLCAELEGIACSGPAKGNKQTYALLSERVPKKKAWTRDEALALLAKKYFTSHGPATLRDFVWWSGLPVKDVRHALEMVKSQFISETIGTETYWLKNSFTLTQNDQTTVYLLPAYDEFIISYRDRTAALILEHHKKAISMNGIFRPVVVVNGQVTGLWKRTVKKDKVMITTDLFQAPDKTTKKLIDKAAETFGHFLGRQTKTNVS